MLDWKPEYVALLSRLYRTHILKVATKAGYLEANAEIGRAAHVRPLTVERWIEGTAKPDAVQGERLLRWAARVTFWEWEGDTTVSDPSYTSDRGGRWVRVSIAEKLSELIRDNKRGK